MELCPRCKTNVQRGILVCPHCGYYWLKNSTSHTSRVRARLKSKKIISIIIVDIAIVVFAFFIGTSQQSPFTNLIFQNEENLTKIQNSSQNSQVVQAIVDNSIFPCNLRPDSSGKTNIDCNTYGSYHFNNPSIGTLELNKVRLYMNSDGTYKALELNSTNQKEYDLGQLAYREITNEIITDTNSMITIPQDYVPTKCKIDSKGTGELELTCDQYLLRDFPGFTEGNQPAYLKQSYAIDPIELISDNGNYLIQFRIPSGLQLQYPVIGKIGDTDILKRVLISYENNVESFDENGFYGTAPQPEVQPNSNNQAPQQPNLQDLYSYALNLVNDDRKAHGVPPVQLGTIGSAQHHSDDELRADYFSHWDTSGVKPYVTYTQLGGESFVEENDYYSYVTCPTSNCIENDYDPHQEIKKAENEMMNDDSSSNWGHRDNIIDPHHTHVNFGISYNHDRFYFVQHFENNIVSWQSIKLANHILHLQGKMSTGYLVSQIMIFSDPSPRILDEKDLDGTAPYNLRHYDQGILVGEIVPRPAAFSNYVECSPGKISLDTEHGKDCVDYVIFDNTSGSSDGINIDVDLTKWLGTEGLHTVYLVLKDESGSDVSATSITLEYLK